MRSVHHAFLPIQVISTCCYIPTGHCLSEDNAAVKDIPRVATLPNRLPLGFTISTDPHRMGPSFYDNFHWHIEVQHRGIDEQTQITATAFHIDDVVLLIDFYDDRIHTQCIRRVVANIEPVVLLSMSAMMPKGLSFSVRTCS